uniref:FH2 domain-containing protein n=1 Tax=Poecilia reticulata TaxID=8081 RepID=A0A3P9MZE7_POERE
IKHCSSNPGGLKKKKRVRSFFWKTIPAEQVKGHANLWTQGPVQQDFQIDVQKIEELFTQSDGPPVSTPTRGGKTRVSFREAKDEVSILDSKRGLNIAIFLKQFKRSNQTLVDEIRHGNSESFGAEPLRELLKLLPDKDEQYPRFGVRLILADPPETPDTSYYRGNTISPEELFQD